MTSAAIRVAVASAVLAACGGEGSGGSAGDVNGTITPVGGGRVLGERLDIATRQTPKQILDMLRGNVFEHLFVKEFLVEPGERHER